MVSKPRTPEYLDREEPVRVPVDELTFGRPNAGKPGQTYLGRCLAKQLVKGEGPNTAARISGDHVTYGDSRVLDDGRRERLVGCSSCTAICTIVVSEREGVGPGTEDDPNVVLSVAEAPDPNPWHMSGNFDACKEGRLGGIPEGAESLIAPQLQQADIFD